MTIIDFERLKAPFPPDKISWRVGATNANREKNIPATKGIALAYIDSRDVMDRLDEVCGPENWQDSYNTYDKTMICRLEILCGESWIHKEDGAGATDVEGEKGQVSDALKRAGVKWGIGRDLYSDRFKNIWVEVEPAGRSYKIKPDEKARLAKIAAGKTQKPPAEEDPTWLKDQATGFAKKLDQCTSLKQLSELVEKNNKLLASLHEHLPDWSGRLLALISKHQEAFHLSDAAE